MADDQTKGLQVVRSPKPGNEAARDAEERRRVTAIERDIEELGRALEDRHRLARFACTPKESPSQVGKFLRIPAIRRPRKFVAEGGRPAPRRKWSPSLFLMLGGAWMLMSDAKVRQRAERAEAALKLSEQDRKRVQVALSSLDHEVPAATGYFGPRTRAMIMAWQKAQGLPGTGYLTEVQLATLQQQAAAALAKYDQASGGSGKSRMAPSRS